MVHDLGTWLTLGRLGTEREVSEASWALEAKEVWGSGEFAPVPFICPGIEFLQTRGKEVGRVIFLWMLSTCGSACTLVFLWHPLDVSAVSLL